MTREFGSADPTAKPSTAETQGASSEATPSAIARPPDLAVTRGDDPAVLVTTAIGLLGGMERFVARGSRVVVKPNILTAREPEFAATTNPVVVGTIVRLAWEAGARSVTVFDHPTAPPRQAYTVSGIAAAVDAADGRMKVLTARDFDRIAIPEGQALTDWPLVGEVFDADVLINVPIAKTHGLAGLTMSMKNLMGVMGGTRGLIHQQFDRKIVDVATLIKPQLVVLDAYRMLVRNGPTGGSLSDVRLARTCVAGTDMVAVDAYGATLFGRTPGSLGYLDLAAAEGIGTADLSTLDIVERAV